MQQQHKSMVVGVHQRAAADVSRPFYSDSDCCDDRPICLQTAFCTLCTASNIQNQMDKKLPLFDGTLCFELGVCCLLTAGDALLAVSFGLRRELVQRYGLLNESVCRSCVLGVCCAPCSLCQVQREMASRGEHCGGFCAEPPIESIIPTAVAMNVGDSDHHTHPSAAAPPQPLRRRWLSSLCGCVSFADVCDGVLCPCVTAGYMAQTLNLVRVAGDANGPLQQQEMDRAACVACLFYPFGYTYANRRELIERYRVAGETRTDTCLAAYCCPCCALLQQRRQMGLAGEWPGGYFLPKPPPSLVV